MLTRFTRQLRNTARNIIVSVRTGTQNIGTPSAEPQLRYKTNSRKSFTFSTTQRFFSNKNSNKSPADRDPSSKQKFSLSPDALRDTQNQINSPLVAYKHLVSNNTLQEDAEQLAVVQKLDGLYKKGTNFADPDPDPSSSSSSSSTSSSTCSSSSSSSSSSSKKSLYIYGPAGNGKSMCMDLFHGCVVEKLKDSGALSRGSQSESLDNLLIREHFHEFLHRVHRLMHGIQRGRERQKLEIQRANFQEAQEEYRKRVEESSAKLMEEMVERRERRDKLEKELKERGGRGFGRY